MLFESELADDMKAVIEKWRNYSNTALANAIATLKQMGTTFVVMTLRSSILGVADKILLMREGTQQAFGPRDEVLAALQQKAQS